MDISIVTLEIILEWTVLIAVVMFMEKPQAAVV